MPHSSQSCIVYYDAYYHSYDGYRTYSKGTEKSSVIFGSPPWGSGCMGFMVGGLERLGYKVLGGWCGGFRVCGGCMGVNGYMGLRVPRFVHEPRLHPIHGNHGEVGFASVSSAEAEKGIGGACHITSDTAACATHLI